MSGKQLVNDLRNLLINDQASSQEDLCELLIKKGYQVNQSKISRLLHKIGAIKSKNEKGEMVYTLPHDAMPPPINSQLAELVLGFDANEVNIILHTSPGSASLIARILDHKKCKILGTIAGDDTVFIAPVSVKDIDLTMELIKKYLGQN